MMTREDLRSLVRTVPDFPKPGILFRDVTTLIGHGPGFSAAVDLLCSSARAKGADAIAGIEARGFIFGAAVAARMDLGFIPVRKPGRLPVPVMAIDYALEYGTDTLEVDPEAIGKDKRIALIDDLIATGGTAMAATELIRRAGGKVEQALFVVDLPDLGGAQRLRDRGVAVHALMAFPGH